MVGSWSGGCGIEIRLAGKKLCREQGRVRSISCRTTVRHSTWFQSRCLRHLAGDNALGQKRTFEWIERNADEISARLMNAVDLIKDEQASLDSFDGVNLTMNSTMTRIVSLADPEQKLVIYDGRVGGALGYFVARFTEEREIHQYDLADQLLFAVDREPKRRPDTNRIHFPALFGNTRDRCHASMVRWASQLIWQVAKECQASPREIEAALFMWGYNVADEPEH